MEHVKCPKCEKGQMVPLSGSISPMTGVVQILKYAEWRCVKCGHSVTANPTKTI